MSSRKIVLIGAGSASFTQGLVADMILTGDAWDIHLVDVNPENLDVAHGVVQRMLAARPAPVTVTATADRRRAPCPAPMPWSTPLASAVAAPGNWTSLSRGNMASISPWAIRSCPVASHAPCAMCRWRSPLPAILPSYAPTPPLSTMPTR